MEIWTWKCRKKQQAKGRRVSMQMILIISTRDPKKKKKNGMCFITCCCGQPSSIAVVVDLHLMLTGANWLNKSCKNSWVCGILPSVGEASQWVEFVAFVIWIQILKYHHVLYITQLFMTCLLTWISQCKRWSKIRKDFTPDGYEV